MTLPMSSCATRRVSNTPRSSSTCSTWTASGSSTNSRARKSRRSFMFAGMFSGMFSGMSSGMFSGTFPARRSGGPGGLRVLLLRREALPDADLGHQHPDGVGRLRAAPEPMQRTLLVDLDHRGVVHRLIPADVLDEPAVARAPLGGDDDPVEGALFGPRPLQPDTN